MLAMADWNYGDAFKRNPIEYGQKAVFNDGSILTPRNIFDLIPAFIKQADLLFCDPPWNQGNLNSFYTKASRNDYSEFKLFYKRLFECIAEISPKTCYIEIGKEYLAEFIIEMKQIFKSVTFYNSMYYHKPENHCYIVRGSKKHQKLPLDGMDEENIIEWICENEQYSCIADPCMGRGLVAFGAFKASHKFVGTELNPKRLSAALERLAKLGAKYEIEVQK
jgi:DNA modification methylase